MRNLSASSLVKKNSGSHPDVRRLTLLAMLMAIVVLLQLLGAFIRFGPFSISLVNIPIVIGAALCGPAAGLWLGLVFGLVVLLSGDAALFLAVNPWGTVLTVLLKGAMAGWGAGLVYKALAAKRPYLAGVVAAAVCPLLNTGVFLLGCLVFFMDTIALWAEAAGLGGQVARYMIFGLAGGNFLFEMLINLAFSPVIVRLIDVKINKR